MSTIFQRFLFADLTTYHSNVSLSQILKECSGYIC